jgi:DNA (cytosine-5)-methyltransferase 1
VPIIDSIGGQAERGWEGTVSPTLKATHYKNPPTIAVPSAGFCTEHSAKARGVGYQEEVAPTLRAGVTPATVYSVENHPADSRVNIDESGKVQTLTSRMETGGGNVPMVMEPKHVVIHQHAQNDSWTMEQENLVQTIPAAMGMGGGHGPLILEPKDPIICLQGNGIDRADTAGCNGKGWKEDTSYTLNTIDRPAVCYSQGGFADYVEGEVGTLRASGGDLGGGTENLLAFSVGNGQLNQISMSEQSNTLDCMHDQQAVLTFAANQRDEVRELGDKATALQAQPGMKQQTFIAQPPHYIVRRLTPTECARLQGFADWWGHIEQKDSLTAEEYSFWLEVRNTHAAINGKKVQDYTEKQMLTWYNKLWTDSAEYKMWGNGIALPPALYCLQGITDALNAEEVDDEWML